MASITPSFYWICVGTDQLAAVSTLLEETPADWNPSTRICRIGDVSVALVGLSSLNSLRASQTWTQLRDGERAGTRIDGVVISAVDDGVQRTTRPTCEPGDVLIRPLVGMDGGLTTSTLMHGLRVLRTEAGDDGSWLSSLGEASHARLHYVESEEDPLSEDIAPCTPP